jgi:hypothetical protein
MGTYSMAFALAYAIGPGAGTFVLERAGSLVLWPAATGVAIVAAVLFASAAKTPANEPKSH